MKVSVILPAAGLGTRMKSQSAEHTGTSKKQFMSLEGAPILLHTVRKFVACPLVTEVLIALRGADLELAAELLSQETFAKPVRCVEGGDTRQNSVENALAALDADVDIIAVHDAVRPFIDSETIVQVILQAAETGAAIVGIVPVDTVKQVQRHVVRGTLNRDRLVLAQTPQVFRAGLLREAFRKAREDQFVGTDESSLVERLESVEVTVVPGSDRNIKITRPSDIELARLFLAEEKRKVQN
ncbi:MAG: 2-C-methyl-D-erythritol 4-phosphate cytidylyltransferase [Acidobacteria bacterium]|nr:2-C-methyl-D-erythritol 4-phosphate cytidylyltransferase [Acidobacteriota bacterium]